MAEADQGARRKAIAAQKRGGVAARRAGEAVRRLDLQNGQVVVEIVRDHGWPAYSMVGKRAGDAFWLLVQHADTRPGLQRRCLALMARAVDENQASPRLLAYLTDRVAVARGSKQRFGTQFRKIGSSGFGPSPIAAPASVDVLRGACGLEPLASYAQTIRKFYPRGFVLRLPPSYRKRAI